MSTETGDVQAPRRAPRKRGTRSVWGYLATTLSAALLLAVLAVVALVLVVPWATGSVPLTILTQSMEPGLPPGTLVVVKPVDAQDIRIGDVVTYQLTSGQPDLVTHRVVAISQTTAGGTSFTFKGDNNATVDANPVVPDQIKGQVWYSLPWIGWVNSAMGGGGRTWLVVGLAVLLFAYAGWMIIGGTVERRKKRRVAQADAAFLP